MSPRSSFPSCCLGRPLAKTRRLGRRDTNALAPVQTGFKATGTSPGTLGRGVLGGFGGGRAWCLGWRRRTASLIWNDQACCGGVIGGNPGVGLGACGRSALVAVGLGIWGSRRRPSRSGPEDLLEGRKMLWRPRTGWQPHLSCSSRPVSGFGCLGRLDPTLRLINLETRGLGELACLPTKCRCHSRCDRTCETRHVHRVRASVHRQHHQFGFALTHLPW